MKTRFSGLDLACQVADLQHLVGMRINKIYDVDKKTYLLRLQRTEEKSVLLIESGSRIHETNSVWPKNDAPSGFTMKLRKHLKNKRLEQITQHGTDRILVLKFGAGEVANFLFVELYDKGNIVLTDHENVILGVLRPRLNDENNKVVARETYDLPVREKQATLNLQDVVLLLQNAGATDTLKKLLVRYCFYGPALLEHLFLCRGIAINKKIRDLEKVEDTATIVVGVLEEAANFLSNNRPRGFIVQKIESHIGGELRTNEEFHPFLLRQHEKADAVKEFDTFNAAVDEFFSQLESQKIDMKVAQQEKHALKKLENIKKDHETRLQQLEDEQEKDRKRGELIEMNCELVDKALTIIRTAIANQIDWKDIEEIVSEAGENGDPVLSRIRKLRLDINHFTMMLANPFDDDSDDDDEKEDESSREQEVELDIDLTAQANARKFYDKKRSAALKEMKTLQSHNTAIKSAERKTKQTLREVAVSANIIKARKTYWFEKFFWFISSENYLVIAGRDQQQNEMLVKRYMAPTDVYVHADLHGASSVVVKNPSGKAIPPKTLNEAGQMAVCYSAGWDSKVVTSAYWVESSQVSKSAPTGEYLTTGSFMIRGKKNYLPPSHLILGFGIMFKLGDESIEKHRGERKVRTLDEMEGPTLETLAEDEDIEIKIEDDELEEGKLSDVKEEPSSCDVVTDEQSSSSSSLKDREEPPINNCEEETSQGEKQDVGQKTSDADLSDKGPQFPDTTLAMDFSSGVLEFKAESKNVPKPSFDSTTVNKTKRGSKKKNDKGPSTHSDEEEQDCDEEEGSGKGRKQQPKRGQKGKQKKIREKYKDQDEEEKELRMQLLHQAQKEDGKRAKKRQKEQQMKTEKENKLARAKAKQHLQQRGQTFRQESTMQDNEAAAEEEGAIRVSDEVDMIDALTGIPVSEDELMFAVAVVGPYNAMTNYKYKVKVTPGTAKRGKAAKTTLAVFMADRAASTREKDLLKSLKEQDVSRNLPGKVKISAPQLQKSKAKAKSS